ncbi:EscU/YscU/HrcU family type III secretion system export apparatus switch protein [Thermosulfurimonas sp. F29]|uniref:EscU/YscU/HrcU family type III secretion system export apparatus switch protein n=1 Tax=Thermosulfurimonas sp. F29 TaxID=2867247 RepID=UPI002103F563|nr:EscU/YscU/HrcU family type III secretion system export apparatus switch protein [Thermosulfurimonas sp. F29]
MALKYEPEKDGAPRVVAKGQGRLAELILEVARRHGIPVREDSELVRELFRLEIEAEIPPELYEAVAVILAWAYRLNRKARSTPSP